jgi:hypothetical protein
VPIVFKAEQPGDSFNFCQAIMAKLGQKNTSFDSVRWLKQMAYTLRLFC